MEPQAVCGGLACHEPVSSTLGRSPVGTGGARRRIWWRLRRVLDGENGWKTSAPRRHKEAEHEKQSPWWFPPQSRALPEPDFRLRPTRGAASAKGAWKPGNSWETTHAGRGPIRVEVSYWLNNQQVAAREMGPPCLTPRHWEKTTESQWPRVRSRMLPGTIAFPGSSVRCHRDLALRLPVLVAVSPKAWTRESAEPVPSLDPEP